MLAEHPFMNVSFEHAVLILTYKGLSLLYEEFLYSSFSFDPWISFFFFLNSWRNLLLFLYIYIDLGYFIQTYRLVSCHHFFFTCSSSPDTPHHHPTDIYNQLHLYFTSSFHLQFKVPLKPFPHLLSHLQDCKAVEGFTSWNSHRSSSIKVNK